MINFFNFLRPIQLFWLKTQVITNLSHFTKLTDWKQHQGLPASGLKNLFSSRKSFIIE